jgi:endonuclease/exonuclease/phosphatase family metal-dependent hydrolase
MDASEKRLFGSGIERLMGTIWKPELCLYNTLFDALKEKDKQALDFSKIATTRFKDPIFNDTWQSEWIDHILYSNNHGGHWVGNATVHSTLPDGSRIWEKYKHASDHYPISAIVTV